MNGASFIKSMPNMCSTPAVFVAYYPLLNGKSILPASAQRHATHVEDNISDAGFDRNKILIGVHPEHKDIWYWLIPGLAMAAVHSAWWLSRSYLSVYKVRLSNSDEHSQ